MSEHNKKTINMYNSGGALEYIEHNKLEPETEKWERLFNYVKNALPKDKKVKIIEAEVCPDHIHMLLEIPPKISVSSFMGYLKGKSSLMIYEKYPELRYKYRNREFWCRGYYVDTAGKNVQKIQEYIQRQLEEDKAGEQLTMGNY